jgi:hypothetical protein
MQKINTKNKKKLHKIEEKCTPKIFTIKHIKNAKKMHPKIQKNEKNTQKLQKSHQKCPK